MVQITVLGMSEIIFENSAIQTVRIDKVNEAYIFINSQFN